MKKKILIVEDERQSFSSLETHLKELGYSVLPETRVLIEKAIDPHYPTDLSDFVTEQVKDNWKDIRLVICDTKLGEDLRGGNKVVKYIRSIKEIDPYYVNNLPIIAITDYPNNEESILPDGANICLLKNRISENFNVIKVYIETFIEKFDQNLSYIKHFVEGKNNNNFSKSIRTNYEVTNNIFIVHGHAEAEEKVARFLEHLGLSPIILHEQPNDGKTIIEKIEKYSNVGYAIVLYTSCDEGKAKEEDNLKPRARQNVVFEHGYMTAKLGRENVCVLQETGVEPPGDISGLVYVPLDDSGAWKLQLAKNLKKRGFDIDMNKV